MKRIVCYIFIMGLVLAGALPRALALPEDDAAQSVHEAAPMQVVPEHPPITEPLSLHLNIPAARLDLYRSGQFVKSYKVAIGQKTYPTPLRDYSISMIIWNPWWIPPESEWAKDAEKTPPGPDNPLGVVKMVMEDELRIHGTNQASSIGRATSHACIRMYNKDAKELAWEIQSRYSEKTDPELLDTYKKRRKISFYVPLFETVPVTVEYRQVERKEDQLLLHPNRYAMDGFSDQLAEALSDHPELIIDKSLLKKLNKMRARKSVQISVEEVLSWVKPIEPPAPAPAA